MAYETHNTDPWFICIAWHFASFWPLSHQKPKFDQILRLTLFDHLIENFLLNINYVIISCNFVFESVQLNHSRHCMKLSTHFRLQIVFYIGREFNCRYWFGFFVSVIGVKVFLTTKIKCDRQIYLQWQYWLLFQIQSRSRKLQVRNL